MEQEEREGGNGERKKGFRGTDATGKKEPLSSIFTGGVPKVPQPASSDKSLISYNDEVSDLNPAVPSLLGLVHCLAPAPLSADPSTEYLVLGTSVTPSVSEAQYARQPPLPLPSA